MQQPIDLSDYLTEIDIYVEWLGWAQPIAVDGWLKWTLHNGGALWKAIKDSVLATDGADEVAKIAAATKSKEPNQKFYFLKQQLSADAVVYLAQELAQISEGTERATFPEPEPEPLSTADVNDLADLISIGGDDAIALMEELPKTHQAQVAAAMAQQPQEAIAQQPKQSPQPNQEPHQGGLKVEAREQSVQSKEKALEGAAQ